MATKYATIPYGNKCCPRIMAQLLIELHVVTAAAGHMSMVAMSVTRKQNSTVALNGKLLREQREQLTGKQAENSE